MLRLLPSVKRIVYLTGGFCLRQGARDLEKCALDIVKRYILLVFSFLSSVLTTTGSLTHLPGVSEK